MLKIRPAEPGDSEAILRLWHQGWHDAHAHLVPPDILAFRTPEYFATWLQECEDRFHVAEDGCDLVGFVSVKGDELVKLYVDRRARGLGAAGHLIAHAEALLAADGVEEASLLCTAGNARAENFYRRCGWHLAATGPDGLWLPKGAAGHFEVPTHRFCKRLG